MTHPPPQPLCFAAESQPRVILLSTGQRPHFLEEIRRLRPIIEQYTRVVGQDFTGQEDVSGVEADLAIVLGGDGSILPPPTRWGNDNCPSSPST